MKRSQFLVALSREHHTALSLARRIHRHAGDPSVLKVLAQQVRDGTAELLAHFAQEESLLLPYMLVPHPVLSRRLSDEHVRLRTYMEWICLADHDCIQDFASLLLAHVRFEERELFPAFERQLVAY